MEEKTLDFWINGEYESVGGYFVRSEIKTFFNKLIADGKVPVGIKIDLESFNLEVIVKK